MKHLEVIVVIQTMRIEWLDTISLTEFIQMIEERPKYIRVTGTIENRDNISLPMFNECFDNYCRLYGRIPSQDEYAEFYLKGAEYCIRANNLEREAVANRARRNVSSFIQEYAIYIILRENNIKGLYDREWDRKGVDFLIFSNNVQQGLCVIADTNGARNYTNLKNKLRRKGIEFTTFSLTTYVQQSEYHNGIYIFNDLEHIRASLKSNKIVA